jgi:hypothetical protein
MPTPEELARINIDKQLTACGWMVQSRNAMNLYAAAVGGAGGRGGGAGRPSPRGEVAAVRVVVLF